MTISDPFPATGFKLLGMTWRSDITPDDQAYTAMKAAITNIAAIWSSTSVYGMVPESPIAGLWLPRHYFERDPQDAPKVTLFIRTAIFPLRRSWAHSMNSLGKARGSVPR